MITTKSVRPKKPQARKKRNNSITIVHGGTLQSKNGGDKGIRHKKSRWINTVWGRHDPIASLLEPWPQGVQGGEKIDPRPHKHDNPLPRGGSIREGGGVP